jgi:hypothetical protein
MLLATQSTILSYNIELVSDYIHSKHDTTCTHQTEYFTIPVDIFETGLQHLTFDVKLLGLHELPVSP